MRTHLLNPSDVSFGTAVITPRWMFVLAAATPRKCGDPVLVDETLAPLDPGSIHSGDVAGIGRAMKRKPSRRSCTISSITVSTARCRGFCPSVRQTEQRASDAKIP